MTIKKTQMQVYLPTDEPIKTATLSSGGVVAPYTTLNTNAYALSFSTTYSENLLEAPNIIVLSNASGTDVIRFPLTRIIPYPFKESNGKDVICETGTNTDQQITVNYCRYFNGTTLMSRFVVFANRSLTGYTIKAILATGYEKKYPHSNSDTLIRDTHTTNLEGNNATEVIQHMANNFIPNNGNMWTTRELDIPFQGDASWSWKDAQPYDKKPAQLENFFGFALNDVFVYTVDSGENFSYIVYGDINLKTTLQAHSTVGKDENNNFIVHIFFPNASVSNAVILKRYIINRNTGEYNFIGDFNVPYSIASSILEGIATTRDGVIVTGIYGERGKLPLNGSTWVGYHQQIPKAGIGEEETFQWNKKLDCVHQWNRDNSVTPYRLYFNKQINYQSNTAWFSTSVVPGIEFSIGCGTADESGQNIYVVVYERTVPSAYKFIMYIYNDRTQTITQSSVPNLTETEWWKGMHVVNGTIYLLGDEGSVAFKKENEISWSFFHRPISTSAIGGVSIIHNEKIYWFGIKTENNIRSKITVTTSPISSLK